MELLNELCKISAVSGNEENYIEFIKNNVLKFTNNIRTDNMNNLIVCMNDDINEDTVIIECSVDTFGIMVCGIEENKKVSFDAVGAVSPHQLLNTFAEFDGEIIGIIRTDKKLDENLKVSDLYLELNVSGNEDEKVSEKIKAGDFCSVKSNIFINENSGTVADDFLSARIPSYCGLKLIEKMSSENCKNNVCVLFTTQKKLGARGTKALLNDKAMNGKFIISVGCAKADENFKINKGCGILAKDSGTVTSLTVRKHMQEIANKNNIPYQININSENQFINSMSVSGTGYLCGGINIPVSKMGQRLEKANMNDINSAVELLYQCII